MIMARALTAMPSLMAMASSTANGVQCVYVVARIQCHHVPYPNILCRVKLKTIQKFVLQVTPFGYIAPT